jgi:hypothetical protein
VSVPRALQVLPRLVGALPDGHHLARRVPAVLEALQARARRVLDLDERWLVLGPCPEIHQDPVPVAWDGADRPIAYVEVRDCMTYDVLGSLDATRKRRAAWGQALRALADEDLERIAVAPGPVDVWRRSHLRIDRDADLATAPVTCPGCGRTWGASHRARLAGIIEKRGTAARLTGQAS